MNERSLTVTPKDADDVTEALNWHFSLHMVDKV